MKFSCALYWYSNDYCHVMGGTNLRLKTYLVFKGPYRRTNFPWEVYFLVCTINKFPLTSFLEKLILTVCTINTFPLKSFLEKFTFSCVRSTNFPWQVFLRSLLSRVYDQQTFLDKFPWEFYFLVGTINKFPLTSFLEKFTFSCVRSTNFPWQVSLRSLLSRVYDQQTFLDKFSWDAYTYCVYGQQVSLDKFPWEVYFLVCTINKLFLTSFLEKFTFSCVRSTSFPWQLSLRSLLSRVYDQQTFLDKFPWEVYFLVCTINKFPLTSFLETLILTVCMINKLSLTSFLEKFTFSCVRSTNLLCVRGQQVSHGQLSLLVCTEYC
jgi:hypothetical protein